MKKLLLSFLLVLICMCSLFAGCTNLQQLNSSSSFIKIPNNAEFNNIMDCVVDLRAKMKDPESFSIYGTCGYKVETGTDMDAGTYIIIPYRATNSYGAYLTSVALYVNDRYMGDYGDKEKDYWTREQIIKFLHAHSIYLAKDYQEEYSKDVTNAALAEYLTW